MKWLLALCAFVAPLTASAAPPDPIGHYYLEGVHEVGSELLLKPGGRYDWYMSYGAMDQFSEGTWRRAGDDIILTVDPRDKRAAIFKLEAREPWNERAEEKAQEPGYKALVAAIYDRCPFLLSQVAMVSSPPMVSLGLTPDPGAGAKAEAADRIEAIARATYERAAALAILPGGDREAKMREANDAMVAWRTASEAMDNAHVNAQTPSPRVASPKLPEACNIPAEPNPANIAPEKWIRGVAVMVGDPAVEMRFSGITVVFGYADCTVSHGVVTDNGGWAIAPDRKMVKRISLSLRGPDPRTAWFDIGSMVEGVQPVTLDLARLLIPLSRL